MMNEKGPQARMLARGRAKSCIDPTVPIGFPPAPRPEIGLSVAEHFRRKHSKGGPGPGQYFGLHLTYTWPSR